MVLVGIDRIGELPDPLLVYILSLLDDMKEAVRTGLLSKRWKHLWTNLDTLVYKWDMKNPSIKKLKRFLLFVDSTLMQCTCPKIKKFCVIGSQFVDKLYPHVVKPLVDKWLDFVIEKNVEVVKLGLQNLDYEFPVCFFQSSSFVRLEVDYVGKHCYYIHVFKSLVSLESDRGLLYTGPYHYRKTYDMRWNKLKSLSLKSVYVLKDVMSEIFLGCPVLETLVLDAVRGLVALDITSPSMRELKVLNLEYDHGVEGIDLIISAPWVERLEISGCFRVVRCNLVSVPSLKSATITLNYSYFYYLVSFDFDEETDVDPDGYFKAVWLNLIDCLLRPVCNVDELVVGVELLQALSLSKLLDVSSPIFNCKYFTLQSPICIHEVPGMVLLLESSPYLETLVIKIMPWQCHFSTYNKRHNYYTNYMEKVFSTLNGIDYLNEQKGKFLCLKNVKIDFTEILYSPVNEDLGNKYMCFELKVVAHIIRNAPVLEKLRILLPKSNSSDFAMRYIELMSSEDEVGDKATGWDLKKRTSTYEFNFC